MSGQDNQSPQAGQGIGFDIVKAICYNAKKARFFRIDAGLGGE